MPAQSWPGRPFPLGATWDGEGTNFALFTSTASSVALALFDDAGAETLVPLTDSTHRVFHGYLPGVGPGQRYGFRVDGRTVRHEGILHSPAKLLVDPYARAIDGQFRDNPAAYLDSEADSAPFVPRSVVTDGAFPWGDDRRPDVPWGDTVIYEMHVKGFTQLHPGVPPALRGTYAGLAHPAAIAHLSKLGVTAVELLPVHQSVSEPHLQARGAVNYWGYNTLGFFAPHAGYAAGGGLGDQVREFKAMVRALHAAGIEVILDVVYNHTAEGPPDGPVLSLRGIDNQTYYRLRPDDRSRYLDYTGCGNTVDARQPPALALIMDSLRYWVTEMHVDGFRFDLASALARSLHDVDPLSAFFQAIHQDPVLRQVKLIAEPWDLGGGGYQVGSFPALWTEWNGKYRDTVRSFWAQGGDGVRDLAYRLTGSSDLYGAGGRLPFASINFITAHDGFTLRDLVSYSRKHNEGNGEGNRDGTDDNRSINHGAEGPTDDPAVQSVRLRQVRSMLTCLLLSTGTPMITAGDERWRTQDGNNNPYMQDSALSWMDWSQTAQSLDIQALATRLLALRRGSPVFRQQAFFAGQPVPGGDGCKDLAWFHPAGRELADADWFDGSLRTLGMYLDGRGLRTRGARGELLVDDSYLAIFHAGDDAIEFALPGAPWAGGYRTAIDTSRPGGEPDPASGALRGGSIQTIPARACLILRVQR